jgi:hypothetical protein
MMKKQFSLFALCFFILIPASALSWGLNGLWRSQGYGYVFDIKNTKLRVFDITRVSLLLFDEFRIDKNVPLRRSGDKLIFKEGNGTIITFDRLGKLPKITQPTQDPEVNFEVFWHTFEENFALFPLTGVDWHSLYEQYRPLVTANTTDEELFSIFCEMIVPLNDGHTFIVAVIKDQEKECESGPVSNSDWMVNRFWSGEYAKVISARLDEAKTVLSYDGKYPVMIYGPINQSIGYLAIFRYSNYEESGDLQAEEAEEAVFTDIVDKVLAEFHDLEALIIDIKFNGGGYDNLTRALANRLTDQKRLAYSKQARIGGYNDFAKPTDFHIKPNGVQFIDKPVVVLISSETRSAGEVQALILDQLPNVTLIGESTYGIFSDALEKLLPNGWRIGLSNERYMSFDGIDYEQKGVPPDVKVIPSEAAFHKGRDNVLEKALRMIKVQVK